MSDKQAGKSVDTGEAKDNAEKPKVSGADLIAARHELATEGDTAKLAPAPDKTSLTARLAAAAVVDETGKGLPGDGGADKSLESRVKGAQIKRALAPEVDIDISKLESLDAKIKAAVDKANASGKAVSFSHDAVSSFSVSPGHKNTYAGRNPIENSFIAANEKAAFDQARREQGLAPLVELRPAVTLEQAIAETIAEANKRGESLAFKFGSSMAEGFVPTGLNPDSEADRKSVMDRLQAANEALAQEREASPERIKARENARSEAKRLLAELESMRLLKDKAELNKSVMKWIVDYAQYPTGLREHDPVKFAEALKSLGFSSKDKDINADIKDRDAYTRKQAAWAIEYMEMGKSGGLGYYTEKHAKDALELWQKQDSPNSETARVSAEKAAEPTAARRTLMERLAAAPIVEAGLPGKELSLKEASARQAHETVVVKINGADASVELNERKEILRIRSADGKITTENLGGKSWVSTVKGQLVEYRAQGSFTQAADGGWQFQPPSKDLPGRVSDAASVARVLESVGRVQEFSGVFGDVPAEKIKSTVVGVTATGEVVHELSEVKLADGRTMLRHGENSWSVKFEGGGELKFQGNVVFKDGGVKVVTPFPPHDVEFGLKVIVGEGTNARELTISKNGVPDYLTRDALLTQPTVQAEALTPLKELIGKDINLVPQVVDSYKTESGVNRIVFAVRLNAEQAARLEQSMKAHPELSLLPENSVVAKHGEVVKGAALMGAHERTALKPYMTASDIWIMEADKTKGIAEDSVLVMRRGRPPFQGKPAIVGGFVDPKEGYRQGRMREIKEEAMAKDGKTLAADEIALKNLRKKIAAAGQFDSATYVMRDPRSNATIDHITIAKLTMQDAMLLRAGDDARGISPNDPIVKALVDHSKSYGYIPKTEVLKNNRVLAFDYGRQLQESAEHGLPRQELELMKRVNSDSRNAQFEIVGFTSEERDGKQVRVPVIASKEADGRPVLDSLEKLAKAYAESGMQKTFDLKDVKLTHEAGERFAYLDYKPGDSKSALVERARQAEDKVRRANAVDALVEEKVKSLPDPSLEKSLREGIKWLESNAYDLSTDIKNIPLELIEKLEAADPRYQSSDPKFGDNVREMVNTLREIQKQVLLTDGAGEGRVWLSPNVSVVARDSVPDTSSYPESKRNPEIWINDKGGKALDIVVQSSHPRLIMDAIEHEGATRAVTFNRGFFEIRVEPGTSTEELGKAMDRLLQTQDEIFRNSRQGVEHREQLQRFNQENNVEIRVEQLHKDIEKLAPEAKRNHDALRELVFKLGELSSLDKDYYGYDLAKGLDSAGRTKISKLLIESGFVDHFGIPSMSRSFTEMAHWIVSDAAAELAKGRPYTLTYRHARDFAEGFEQSQRQYAREFSVSNKSLLAQLGEVHDAEVNERAMNRNPADLRLRTWTPEVIVTWAPDTRLALQELRAMNEHDPAKVKVIDQAIARMAQIEQDLASSDEARRTRAVAEMELIMEAGTRLRDQELSELHRQERMLANQREMKRMEWAARGSAALNALVGVGIIGLLGVQGWKSLKEKRDSEEFKLVPMRGR